MNSFRFTEPQFLLLLLLLPPVIYLGIRIQSLRPARKFTATTLRVLAIAAIVFALAGAEHVERQDKLAVFFLLDYSESIPEETRRQMAQWTRNFADANMTEEDAAGVIAFGADASVELGIASTLGLRDVRSIVNGTQTDLASAIRLGMAAFPEGYMRRIVIFSDGQETRGAALEEVKAARGAGAGVDVVPVHKPTANEVRMVEVASPAQANANEPFQIRVVVRSEQETEATLQLYQRASQQRIALPAQTVHLRKGDNVFLLSRELPSHGFYQFEASVEAAADTFIQNNTAYGFTAVFGEPRILVARGSAEAGDQLENALREEGLDVVSIGASELPSSLAELQNFDAVALKNVSAIELSPAQLAALEAGVRDQGIGLVMIGGPESYGAGGYLNTPVERALPVSMDIKQRKVLPRGALAVIMHTCEFQSGNAWARDITLAALDTLASQDLMGGLGYTYNGGDGWLFELQPVGDKQMLQAVITKSATEIGDMPAVEPTMVMGGQALAAADAAVKRMVMISDGDPAAPSVAVLDDLAAKKIAVSTICISPHSMNDQNMLRHVAERTGGNYYFVTDPQRLPQIFSKEASVVRRGVLIEKEFTPQVQHRSEVMTGLTEQPLPNLRGYVVTTPKDEATVPLISHEGDPILAHWRYGLGKAVAFTSDTAPRWAVDWLAWGNFQRFWAQSVRWAMRDLTPENLRVSAQMDGSTGRIRIDAVNEQGEFINFLDPKAAVTTPDYDRTEVSFEQTAPGVYEGTFEASTPGVYMASIAYAREDGSTGMLPAGLSLNYSPEYAQLGTNLSLLESIAATSGGEVLNEASNPFRHDLRPASSPTPLFPWLLTFAACALPVEVFARRVMLPWGMWVAGMMNALRRVPGMSKIIRAPRSMAAPVTGAYMAAAGEGAAATAPEPAAFGQVTAPAPEPERKQAKTKDAAPEAPGKTAYTSELLAAKQRAQRKQRVEKDDTNSGGTS